MSIIGKLLFNTQNRNYMKRDPISSSTDMAGPNELKFAYYRRVLTINHNLKYVPMVRVYYEPYLDGTIMEAYTDTQKWIGPTPNNFVGPETAPTCFFTVSENTLEIELWFIDATLANNLYKVYWVIYRDYGVA